MRFWAACAVVDIAPRKAEKVFESLCGHPGLIGINARRLVEEVRREWPDGGETTEGGRWPVPAPSGPAASDEEPAEGKDEH